MTQPNPSTAMARVLIDELFRNGVDYAVSSPGSRSGALAIAASEHPGIELRVVLDERSAAFNALGRAKATGRPAAVMSTSGTAVANHFPAVVEADASLTPLVVMSADRPAELRGVGANQTIDQVRLFGNKVRWFCDLPAPEASRDLNSYWRSVASHAVARSLGLGHMPGPVHLNVAFREPTVPVSDDGRSRSEEYHHAVEGRPGGAPWHQAETPTPGPAKLDIAGVGRGLVIAGEGRYDRDAVLEAAGRAGWPVLATAMSALRGRGVVTAYHHLLEGELADHLRPELAYVIGAIGPSPRLDDLVSSAGIRVRVDWWGRRLDPRRDATHLLAGDPAATLARLEVDPMPGWREAWLEADRLVRAAIDDFLAEAGDLSGAAAARALSDIGWEVLVGASSLPIREIDAHVSRSGPVIANRGASGVDGFVSTSLGVASAGRRTLALSGDLALLHDAGGFIGEVNDDLVMVVIDNEGGGLFDSLPQAIYAPSYERLFVAPHGRDLAHLAQLHQLSFTDVTTRDELVAAASEGLEQGGLALIRVPVDRQVDLKTRTNLDEIARSVASSLQP